MRKDDLINLRLENRENKVIRNLINTIIGELDRVTKEPTSEQIIKVIKKMHESNCLVTQTEEVIVEQEFLSKLIDKYSPKMLNKDEIIDIIKSNNLTDIGGCMKYFKSNYSGQYNGKELSEIFKSL